MSGFLIFYSVAADYKTVCYITNWAQYRHGVGQFWASDVDPFLCTHVIYAFAKVSGNNIAAFEWNDINEWGFNGIVEL
jgi:chitinase